MMVFRAREKIPHLDEGTPKRKQILQFQKNGPKRGGKDLKGNGWGKVVGKESRPLSIEGNHYLIVKKAAYLKECAENHRRSEKREKNKDCFVSRRGVLAPERKVFKNSGLCYRQRSGSEASCHGN